MNNKKQLIFNIYEKYNFLNLSFEEIKKIVEEESIQLENTINNNLLIKKVKLRLERIIKSKINNDKEKVNIINNYIANNIKFINKYDEDLKSYKKIINFIKKYEIELSIDEEIKILENNTILNIIKKIVDENIYIIKNNNLEYIFKSEKFISLVKIYCMINNIDIIEFDDTNRILDSNIVTSYLINMGKLNNSKNKKIIPLSKEEEIKYFKLMEKGDEVARQILIERNLGLVILLVKKYKNNNIILEDLIQEGNLGLIKAVDNFDYTKGYKFSTYAYQWINEKILRAFGDQLRNIRLSFKAQEEVKRFTNTKIKLENKLNRTPTLEEIAYTMKISYKKAKILYQIEEDTISLSMKVGDNEELIQNLKTNENEVEDKVIKIKLQEEVSNLLKLCNLTEKEIEILKLRYPSSLNKIKSLSEIASIYNISRERVRQIEESALKKIRQNGNTKKLIIYLDKPEQALENLKLYQEAYKTSKRDKKINLEEKILVRKR